MADKKTPAYDYKAKKTNIDRECRYMLAKTNSMFEYSGLPATIPARDLERILQSNGSVFVTEHEGNLYALTGGMGGELDAYYNPTTIIVANPWLKLNKQYNIHTDGVLMRSDSMEMGLLEMYQKYCTMTVENDINMVMYGYNSRMQKMLSAPDDKTRKSAETFMSKLVDGDLSVIADNALFEGLKVHTDKSGSSDTVKSLIEFQQYTKASLMNEIGLAVNVNMKRERSVASEIEMQQDTAFPLVYDMMARRQEAVKAINEKYGTNIKVGFGSVWAVNIKEFADGVVDNAPVLTDAAKEVTEPVKTEPVVEAAVEQTTEQVVETPAPEAEPVKVEPVATEETTDESKQVEKSAESDKSVVETETTTHTEVITTKTDEDGNPQTVIEETTQVVNQVSEVESEVKTVSESTETVDKPEGSPDASLDNPVDSVERV